MKRKMLKPAKIKLYVVVLPTALETTKEPSVDLVKNKQRPVKINVVIQKFVIVIYECQQ